MSTEEVLLSPTDASGSSYEVVPRTRSYWSVPGCPAEQYCSRREPALSPN